MVIVCLKRLENDWDVKPQYKRTQARYVLNFSSFLEYVERHKHSLKKKIKKKNKKIKNECHYFVCGLKYHSLTIFESK